MSRDKKKGKIKISPPIMGEKETVVPTAVIVFLNADNFLRCPVRLSQPHEIAVWRAGGAGVQPPPAPADEEVPRSTPFATSEVHMRHLLPYPLGGGWFSLYDRARSWIRIGGDGFQRESVVFRTVKIRN